MAKCTACKGIILFGGETNRNGQFCNNDCVSKYYVAIANDAVPRPEMEKILSESFKRNCPQCNGEGPIDLHQSTKITSYIVAYTITKNAIMGCVKCGKSHKLKAGLHTLFFGIWSPRGLFLSLFYFPAGVISSLGTSIGREPSRAFSDAIKANVGESILAKTGDSK
jgi:hypothetical protein